MQVGSYYKRLKVRKSRTDLGRDWRRPFFEAWIAAATFHSIRHEHEPNIFMNIQNMQKSQRKMGKTGKKNGGLPTKQNVVCVLSRFI